MYDDDEVVNWVVYSTAGTSGLGADKSIKNKYGAFSYQYDSDGSYITHLQLHYMIPDIRADLGCASRTTLMAKSTSSLARKFRVQNAPL